SRTHTLATPRELWPTFVDQLENLNRITLVRNQIDHSEEPAGILSHHDHGNIGLSAATGSGLHALKQHLTGIMGFHQTSEGGFTARRRHLDALERAHTHLHHSKAQLQSYAAGELLAEDLRLAQQALSEITGEFTPDDLLGRIFSSFCIGK